jgi:putative ABC transport system permease protein
LTASGDPAQVSVIRVADGFFDLLGAGAEEGRLLSPSDQKEIQGDVAVLSDSFWRSHFGADPTVIGRVLTLDKREFVVVGVAARGFVYPNRAEIWIPLVPTKDDLQNATLFSIQVIARLRRGETISQVQSQLSVIAKDIITANPALKIGYGLHATSLLERRIGNIRSTYLMLFGAASFVLLIACANLASLLLARGWGRQREMALRTALGATRMRIIRQALVESCMLGLLGGTAGAILASLGISAFRQIAPASTPRLNEIAADSSMFWFALGSSLIGGILFGLAPALRASRTDPNFALKEGAVGSVSGKGGRRHLKLGVVLVVSEIALAFILLIGAVVTTEGLTNLLKTDTGIRTDHLLTFDLPFTALADENLDAIHSKIQNILGRVRALPGVEEATATDHSVLGGALFVFAGISIEGDPALSIAARSAQVRYVSPSYFEMLGVHLIRGRFFTERDVTNSEKVAIVNEGMARQIWGTADAVGKRFRVGM